MCEYFFFTPSLSGCSRRPQLRKQPRRRRPQSWRRNSTTPEKEKHEMRGSGALKSQQAAASVHSRPISAVRAATTPSLLGVQHLPAAERWLLQKGLDEGRKKNKAVLVISRETRLFDLFYRLRMVQVTLAFFNFFIYAFSQSRYSWRISSDLTSNYTCK